MSTASPRFKPGDRVRVRMADPPGHIRTPFYVRGKIGWIAQYHGAFRNPEELAYGRDGLPLKPLYMVGFKQADLWEQAPSPAQDTLYVDIYEHWLEPSRQARREES